MKIYTIIISLLLSGPFCFAQSFNFNKGGTPAKNYYEEIPYENNNGRLFVYAEIAGKKHKFLFDTGSPVTISETLAAESNAASFAKDLITDVNGSSDSLMITDLKEIKIGRLVFNHIPALILSSYLYQCWGIDGVIGSNLLRNSIVQINSKKQVIILTDQQGKLSLNLKNAVPMITTNSRQSEPVIQVKLNNKLDLQLQFDTGDKDFLRMSEELMDKLSRPDNYILLSKGYGASSIGGLGIQQKADKYLIKIPFLNIGRCRFDHVVSETQKNGIPGIGSKLLNYGMVTLDFIHSRFYFDAFRPVNDLNDKQWPFQPTVSGDQLVVGVVWEKGINLVKYGEQIIAVDGTPFQTVNLCDLLNNNSNNYCQR